MAFNKEINGFQNEIEIRNELNRKYFSELNPMYKSFIEAIFENVKDEDFILCWVDFTKKKYDIVISINCKEKYVIIKKGIKNSVHVEGISSFIHFLIENGIQREIIIEYLKYHYANGSTNGTGKERVSAEVYKKENQEKIDKINTFLNNEKLLIKAAERFILKGRNSNKYIDVLLFGVSDDFIWIKREDIIKVILEKKNSYSSAVHFGPLTIQPVDRCLNYNPKYEKRRLCVQLKWYNLADDIIENMNDNVMKQK